MLRARTATLKRAFVLVRVELRHFPHEKPQAPRLLDILAGRCLNITRLKFIGCYILAFLWLKQIH